MSAFLLPKVRIDAIVTAAIQWADHPEGFRYFYPDADRAPTRYVHLGTADRVGAMLWQANFDRTGSAPLKEWGEPVEELPPYVFEELTGVAEPLLVLKVLACYLYQTAEEPHEWRQGEPAALLDWLEREAITRLPGWDDRPGWPIEDPDVFRAG